MFSLALNYQQHQHISTARHWLQQALYAGHPQALNYLISWFPQHEKQWLRQAAAYGHPDGLVFHWLENSTPPEQVSLSPLQLRQLSPLGRSLLAHYSFQYDAPAHLPHWRALAPSQPRWRERIQGDEVLRRTQQPCHFNLRLYTQSKQPQQLLSWLAKLDTFFASRGYRLCASKQVLDPSVNCSPQTSRAYCQLTMKRTQPVSVVVTEQGDANTRNGVVYINQHTHWRVLLHELGHALGLADEYPMSQDLAQSFCAGQYNFYARNIMVAEPRLYSQQSVHDLSQQVPWQQDLTTAIAQPVRIQAGEYFRLGSNEPQHVGLFPASTCAQTPAQAWKPFAQQTFMEYHHAQFIPDLYLQWMAEAMALRE
ncbi:hypothetical protein CWE15_01385 [Aliidiomarina taiwanensis]|uniref:Uncharacterized protein n=2 Tax=Aliidiomarina taiwanensis TaxID=946228 RepID=A0A432X977_9GAMM|nr:hypothetical protein CWE15_01385 [Aliidiomarina taiwanensis]